MKFTKKDLSNMSLSSIRAIDIRSPEEEELIQEEIDKRIVDLPLEVNLNIPASFTDNLTPEKERVLQAKIDAKVAAIKAARSTNKTIPKTELTEPTTVVEPIAPLLEPTVPLEPVASVETAPVQAVVTKPKAKKTKPEAIK